MRALKTHLLRIAGGVAAAALVASAPLAAQAREIEIDEVTITAAGSKEGRSSYVPWSGIWWPFTDLELARGWNGTGADFTYNESAKRWDRSNTSKPVNDRSPLLKYDEYVRLATGTDPQSALNECKGDDAQDFGHSVYGDKKAEYDRDGISYSWWGHCNGWCGAALMEKEPIGPIEARGIRFEVPDLKGLLSELFWGVESDFTGRRYNKPRALYSDNRQPAKDLLAALNSGSPKPVADYIAWYEKVYETTMSASARASAVPGDFRDELEGFETWFVNSYDNAFADLKPEVFHRILETVIGRKKLAFVMDITANEEVWNHPAFAYTSSIAFGRDFTESNAARKEWTVTTTVWYATDGVSESIIGISEFTKTYTYKLVTDSTGKVIRGEWTGSSIDNHPDFAWLPTYNPRGPDYGENWKIEYGKALEFLPLSHGTDEGRVIDLAANGTAASTRRGNDKTTTWSQPVTASGDVALTVSVASGRTLARVKYFEQAVSGSSSYYVEATRASLVALGESTTSPAFPATVRFTTNGKKMVVAYGYDSANKLVAMDELTIQYTTSGGGGTPTPTDDGFEQNDSKTAAATVAAGSFPNLYCGDDDWYKIVTTSTGAITVRIDFSHAEGDLDMVFEGPSGQISKSESTSNVETVTGSALAAGTYHVRVFGYSGAKAKYSMTVTVTGGGTTPTPTDDTYEPNNTLAAARLMTPGTFSGLKCNDDDYFKVTLTQTSKVVVKIDFRNAEGDLDLIFFNASGTRLASSESTADSETVTQNSLAAGTYSFRVFGYNGAKAPYSMSITVTATSTTPTPTQRTGTVTASVLNIRRGPGSSYAVATTLAMGRQVTILGESGSYYKVTWSGAPSGDLYAYKTYIRINP